MVCAGCGSANSLYEHGRAETGAWRDVHLRVGAGGKPIIEAGPWQTETIPNDEATGERIYGCSTVGCEFHEAEAPLRTIAIVKPREGQEPPPPVIPGQEKLPIEGAA